MAAPGTVSDEPLEIREIKIIEDNGQHGVFVKLNRAPRDVSHFTLAKPNRIVIDLAGDTAELPMAEQYPVENPVVERVRVGSHNGRVRLTIVLRSEEFPTYTVDELSDTLVAFLGEPRGSEEPVREQIVYTRRAVPQVAAAAAPAQVVARVELEPAAPEPRVEAPPLPPEAPPVAPPPLEVRPSARKLYFGQPISLDLKEADIHNVIRLLAEVSKLNIVATDDVRGKITLRLFDVPWDQALDIILQVMNLESIRDGNVLRISTVTRLRQEREELARAQRAAEVIEPLQVDYIKVNYAKATKLADLIGAGRGGRGGRGGAQAGVLTPRGSVLVDEFTNTLIVRDISEGVQRARELVRRLDVQTPQILIESSIVEATTNFARDLGVQWGYRASVGPQTGTSTGQNFPGTVDFGGTGLTTGQTGVPFIADFPALGNFAAGSGSALDLALGSLDGSQSLDVRLTALEEQGKAKIISRPRVVTLNNVQAAIKSLTIIRVRLPSTGTVINTGAGGAAGTSLAATEEIETGIQLLVTPQVSADGFVLLNMFVKSSQADFTRTVDNIPTEITREATSNLLVRDGQTVVLGGIYRDDVRDNSRGIPFFGRIPGIGWLFRGEGRASTREDLLVFLTPRIIGGAAAAKDLPKAGELWQKRGELGPG
jgi:type IV pilus assembly protein PilQ